MTDKGNIEYRAAPGGSLNGNARVPGDKSVSHRSIMLGALADGVTEIEGFLEGEDSLATLRAFRDMGVVISDPDAGRVVVQGVGLHGLNAPKQALDLGNSGTSMRLIAGLMAGQDFDCTLVGDTSLSRRPMRRVSDPLTEMGAQIETGIEGTPPLHIHGGGILHGIDYDMPVASAQVKSSLLLAGLYAQGVTRVKEPAVTRDHTERMLEAFGYPVQREDGCVSVMGGGRLRPTAINVPGDISSAAFFIVGASIAPDSDILLQGIGINPTRTGVIDIMRLMGARIDLQNERLEGGEPVADIHVLSSTLVGIDIPEALVPLAIDEFPAIFVAAACARGTTRLRGARELRVKESDRIQVMAEGLQALGVDAIPTPDGMIINGGDLRGSRVDSHGDHRIAMSFAMAALRAKGEIVIDDCQNVATSFPGFPELAGSLGLQLAAVHADE